MPLRKSKDRGMRWMTPELVEDAADVMDASPRVLKELLNERGIVGRVIVEEQEVEAAMVYQIDPKFVQVISMGAFDPVHMQEMLEWLMETRLGKKRTLIEWILDERDLDLQLWLRANGWLATVIVHDYFEDDGEKHDGYRFVYRLGWKDVDDILEEMYG